jgi:putative endonuclease
MDGWIVYLLRCRDGSLYCGITNDIDRRLKAHGRGGVKYTRGRLPVEVVYVEPAADKGAALRAEAAWKRLPRARKLSAIAGAAVRPATCLSGASTVSHKDAEALPTRRRARRKRLS